MRTGLRLQRQRIIMQSSSRSRSREVHCIILRCGTPRVWLRGGTGMMGRMINTIIIQLPLTAMLNGN
ncbi:hypothetical protein EMPG_15871 [Blastomyces silverae]|uniref:Uncharacterized protein n=1 Tax=Blastomyces silverae TaxID=2060906 RepID=A0A0H1BB51_9EURO|nr:hypothetical protein EMPG_15871 [Blastomyces silverae]